MSSREFHLSKNRLGGSLTETPLDELLASCAKHLITGTIAIDNLEYKGRIELRAGGVHDAAYRGHRGEPAVVAMRALRQGTYDLAQRLPELDGALGSAAECRGDLRHSSVIEIMRHCEDQALSCTITVIADFDRAEITYRAGDIARVLLNGTPDEDALVDVVKWQQGKFRVTVPPLALDIGGWPSASKDPTVPFNIRDAATLPPPKKPARPVPAAAPVVTKPRPPSLPAVESFHHAPRLDPSGQLSLRRNDLSVGGDERSSAGWSLLALALTLATLWVVLGLVLDRL